MQDPPTAVELGERAVASLEASVRESDLRLAEARHHLGSMLMVAGDFDRGEELMGRALEVRIAQLGPGHSTVAETRRELAILSIRQGDMVEARQRLEAARDEYERVLGLDHPRSVDAAQELGIVYLQLGMCAEAQELLTDSLNMGRRLLGRHPTVALVLQYLGILRFYCGPLAESLGHLQEAVATFEATLGPDHYRTASALAHLSATQRAQGDFDGAETSLQRVWDIRLDFYGAGHSAHAETLRELGLLARDRDRLPRALELLTQALELRRKTLGEHHPDTLRSELDIARVRHLQGNALEAREETLEIRRRLVELFGETHIHVRYADWVLGQIAADLG